MKSLPSKDWYRIRDCIRCRKDSGRTMQSSAVIARRECSCLHMVCGDDRLILVDTGFSDADADIIMNAIKDMDHRHEDLKLCILTHRHGDHTGGLKKLKKTLKFQVMAHELDMPAIQKTTGYDVEHVVRGLRALAGLRRY